MKKKLICTILILNLVFVPCYQSYAEAGTITIAGGTIGIGGLSAGALAGLAGPAVVAVFCGMLAVGMDIELTQASQQAGMTKTQFLKSKIEQYCHEANITAGVFYKGITDNMTITRNGAIQLGTEAGAKIKQFCNWLWSSNQVDTSGNGSSIGNNVFDNATYSSTGNFLLNGNGPMTTTQIGCYAIQVKFVGDSRYYTYVYKKTTTVFELSAVRNNSVRWTYPTSQHGEFMITGFLNTDWGDGSLLSNIGYAGEFQNASEFISVFTNYQESTPTDTFTGDQENYGQNSGALSPSNGETTVINPGLVGQIPIPADTDVTVNVRDYLDALERVLDGIQDRIIQGIDTADGIPKDWDIPDDVAIDPTIDTDPPVPEDDSTPVTDDNPPNPDSEPNLATEPLKFNLTNLFPFCIPFDIKDMLQLLKAEPVAPRYTVDWDIPFVDQNFTFTVDLSGWSDVAYILRKMEILAFVIGLALVTRNLIRG